MRLAAFDGKMIDVERFFVREKGMEEKMKKKTKTNKKSKIIILITVVLLIALVTIIIVRNEIINKQIEENEYLAIGNENSSLLAGYIRKGVTIGGVTGTLESLDTSDATAIPEDPFINSAGILAGNTVGSCNLSS